MRSRGIGATVLGWAARLGLGWYAIPSLFVILVGVATCSLIDEPDLDRFDVVRTYPHPSGVRMAVVARQRHADSGSTFLCLWLVAAPAPSSGPTRRLAESCALVATNVDMNLDLRWRSDGRLGVKVPPGTGRSEADARRQQCYFEAEQLGWHVCYRPELIAIE